MSGGWEGSNRRQELPPNWGTEIRPRILDRDAHRCVIRMRNGTRCRDKATEVDHIGDRHDHSDANLQAICTWHHKRKTAQEGNAARTRPTNRRPPETHPGLL